MCRPFRYVYPGCGHPVDLDLEIWTIERCRLAHLSNRDCWIPQDIPDELIERKPWPNDSLSEPCYMPHEPQKSDAEFESSIMQHLAQMGEDSKTSIVTLQANHDNDEDAALFTQEMLLDESVLLNYEEITIGGEEESLSHIDFPGDEGLVIDEEASRYEQSFFLQDPIFSSDSDELSFIGQIVDDTISELSIAATEDNVEWAQVVALGVDMTPFDDEEIMDINDYFT
ncbi:hypothetical protein FHETE_9876 [Fusarium heterosporum]|uniref:Uncharacterized protein n=1 Tax=Fusarium heterosporum TaxID=42747 RepID=A0A8H5SVJ8_FUSHE|nr:hypothetical protein FHETE_9876 [Fusarium heterosporum]